MVTYRFTAEIHASACLLFSVAAAMGYNVVHPGDVSLKQMQMHDTPSQ
jgi:hypothetical protein